jgi:hypothetical protein
MPAAQIEEGLRTGDQATTAYCYMHPGECGIYQEALDYQETPWLLWAALAAGGLLALKAVVN